ncbi:MAG: hypothetical protein E3K40_06120 [Candidatus Brocadia sp.]|nr:hypothetical protein [Candidatus Brocadia sp.]
MRRRRLEWLWRKAYTCFANRMHITRYGLLMHIGASRKEAGRDFGLIRISLPNPREPANENMSHFSLDRERLR